VSAGHNDVRGPEARQLLLGQKTDYPDRYAPELLMPLPRQRDAAPAFAAGADIWNAYELSWLDATGLPRIALLELTVDALSPFLVESKSLKLYLNSFSQTRFDSPVAVRERITGDLAGVVGVQVEARLFLPGNDGSLPDKPPLVEPVDYARRLLDCLLASGSSDHDSAAPPASLSERAQGGCASALKAPSVQCLDNTPRADDPRQEGAEVALVSEALFSNLLKTNCPVTGQPDWATVFIVYQGARLDRRALLESLVALREHRDFHEHCVEQIFARLLQDHRPASLLVYARYTRRGGIDINPWRATRSLQVPNLRLVRQ